jgi:hypothetical protein
VKVFGGGKKVSGEGSLLHRSSFPRSTSKQQEGGAIASLRCQPLKASKEQSGRYTCSRAPCLFDNLTLPA